MPCKNSVWSQLENFLNQKAGRYSLAGRLSTVFLKCLEHLSIHVCWPMTKDTLIPADAKHIEKDYAACDDTFSTVVLGSPYL